MIFNQKPGTKGNYNMPQSPNNLIYNITIIGKVNERFENNFWQVSIFQPLSTNHHQELTIKSFNKNLFDGLEREHKCLHVWVQKGNPSL